MEQHENWQPAPQQPKKKHTTRTVIIAVVVVLVVLVALGSCFSSGGTSNAGAPGNSSVQPATEQNAQTTGSSPSQEQKEEVPVEYQNALKKAQQYSDIMHMSKQGIHDQLTSEYGEGFSKKAADYAVKHVDADWNANALAKAKDYQSTMSMSKKNIKKQLTSDYGEKFTEKQAEYAIEHLDD